MTITIEKEGLKHLLGQATFISYGDYSEKMYSTYVLNHFPKCEDFWRLFVVPLTRRIENVGSELEENINFREGADPQLMSIASAHYSMFMHLAYAHWHFDNRVPSWLENIYTHLVSACDLAEIVIEKWYLLMLQCKNKKSKLLHGLTREEVMAKAGKWYDKYYAGTYEYYYSKGKSKNLNLLAGEHHENLLLEYYGDSEEMKEYLKLTDLLRPFRNVVVHNVKLATLIDFDTKIQYVPKLEMINSYKTWQSVQDIAGRQEIIDRDFTEIGKQILESIERLEIRLNALWNKLILDVIEEFYSTERDALRKIFAIELSGDSGVFVVGENSDVTRDNDIYTSESGTYPREDLLK